MKKFILQLPVLLCLGLVSFITNSQAQSNDECSNAISLIPAITCSSTSGSITTATVNAGTPVSNCEYTNNGDVWFSFVADNDTQLIAVSNITSVNNVYYGYLSYSLYEGTCSSLSEVVDGCGSSSYGSEPDPNEDLLISGLTVGNTYYIKVWKDDAYDENFDDMVPGNINFEICVKAPPPPPGNDQCANAIVFPAIPTDGTCASQSGSTQGATMDLAACAGGGTNDVWYQFTASAPALIFELTTSGDMVTEVFSGTSCTSLTSLSCNDPEEFIVSGLTTGNNYYVRIYNWSDNILGNDFDLCIKTPPPPPPNDECTGAIALTVSTPYNGNNESASQSMAPIECETYLSDTAMDVWYSVTATATGTATFTLNQTDIDAVAQLFSGSCGTLTDIACVDEDEQVNVPVTNGQTYYIRVYEYSDYQGGDFEITFDITPSANTIDSVVVATQGSVSPVINTNGGTLQMTATVYPTTASQDVTWSIVPGTGAASISSSGLVTAQSNGTVWAKAASVADPAQADSMQVTISNQAIPVDSVVVATQGGVPASITTNAGSLQMLAAVYPANADQNVTWSIVPVTGAATISTSGLVTAQSDGTVWAKAASVADPTQVDSMEITIAGQEDITIDSVVVTVQGGGNSIINTAGGTLQLNAVVYPSNADQGVNWVIVPATGNATISATGLVTATANGTVWAKATSVADAGQSDSVQISISNQGTAAADIYAKTGIHIFPNPASDILYFSIDKPHEAIKLNIIDAYGKVVHTEAVASGSQTQQAIPLQGLSAGMYYLNIQGATLSSAIKFIKK